MNSSRSYLIKAFLVSMVCAIFALAAFAQSTTDGAIAGVVTDQSKAVVVNAKVTAHNLGTNTENSAVTDAQGHFRIIKLQPGTYSVAIAADRFSAYTQPKVVVEVGLITNLDFALAVAGTTEKVEVTAEAPTVNTEQQDFTTNLNQESINNLPTNGRRWSNFALLTPGTSADGDYGLISFRGISGLMNNSTVDGGDNNQAFFSEERGRTRTNYVVSQNSVREFQVNTSNYSAEYGRAAGAVVNTVTKSGTNNLHGEAFYYIRDNTLGATNPFTTQLAMNPDGTAKTDSKGNSIFQPLKPTDRRQQFGANIGGPIVKDKLFFFFNYDGQRQNIPGVAMPSKPNSIFGCPVGSTCVAGTQYTAAEQKTIAQGIYGLGTGTPTAAQMTAAGTAFDNAMGFLMGTTGEQPRNNNQDIFFPKLDWRVSQNNTLTMSYNRMRRFSLNDYQTQPNVSYARGDWGNDGVKVDMFNARLTSIISSTVTNELRFSYGHELDYSSAGAGGSSYDPLKTSAANLYQENGASFLPDTYFSGPSYNFGLPYTLNRTAYPNENRQQFADTMTWAHGKHLFKFGGDITRTHDLMDNLFEAGGDYSYTNRASWIIDYTNMVAPVAAGANAFASHYNTYAQSLGKSAWEFNTFEYAGFFQDDYRILPRLTINYGLRYEYEQLPSAQIPNSVIPQTTKLPSDKNNFAPRIGFAWDLFGNGKTAIRGGYGMYYGRFVNSLVANAIYGTGLMSNGSNCGDVPTGLPCGQATYSSIKPTTTSGGVTTITGPIYPNIITASTTQKQNVVYFAPNAQAPQIHQADFVFEQEISKNTVLSVSYLLSLGRELTNFRNENILPTDGAHNVTESLYGGPFDGASFSVPIYTTKLPNCSASITSGCMPAPGYNLLEQINTSVNSSYNAMVVQLNRRMTSGLQFQTSYTWSHALDSGQNGSVNPPSSGTNVYDPFNPQLDYGTSNFDMRSRFVGSAVWQPSFFHNSGKFTKSVLDGWLLAPIVTLQTGRPYTESLNGYPYLPSGWSYAWSGSGLNESGGTARLAPLVGRNNWRYPTLKNVDLRLSRSFSIKEGQKLEVVAEAFNLFNHPNTTSVYTQMYSMCSTSSTPYCNATTTNGVDSTGKATVTQNTWVYDPSFGSTTAAGNSVYRERQVQFAIRYSF